MLSEEMRRGLWVYMNLMGKLSADLLPHSGDVHPNIPLLLKKVDHRFFDIRGVL